MGQEAVYTIIGGSARKWGGLKLDFFRHCPACGHRFHIKLESRELTRVLERQKKIVGRPPYAPYTLSDTSYPVIVDVDEFQYNYKCGLCAHEWSEKRTEKHLERESTSP